MDNFFVLAFIFWPLVVLLCAGINMLVTWTFSWSELIFDYVIGVLLGAFFFAGTQPNASDLERFFLVFSHGLYGLLWVASDGFRESLKDPATFCWTLAGVRVAATLWTAAWDHLTVKLGAKLGPAQFFFSLLLAPAKMPFALLTSAVGFLIWLVGLATAIFGGGKAGFAGGVLFAEYRPGPGGYYATLGCVVNTWLGNTPFKHELYHSRQYIYMSDWLTPLWVLGMVWGVLSALVQKAEVTTRVAFAAQKTGELGNPIEVAAYRLSDF
jgi:hypothetical protein